MRNFTKKLSFVTMVFLMFTALCFNHVSAAEKSAYEKFSGTVISYIDSDGPSFLSDEAEHILEVKSNDGTTMKFNIDLNTYIDTGLDIIGSNPKITCFYNKNQNFSTGNLAIAIVDNSTMVSAFLGRFDDNLLDDTNFLKITIGDKTQILTKDGNKYTGDIRNKELLVFSTVMTASIPAQTTPSKIVVMGDVLTTSTETNTPEETNTTYEKFSGRITALVRSKNKTTITVQSTKKEKKTFEIISSTYKDTGVKIAKNARVTCFYDNSKSSSSKHTALAITNTSNTTVFLGKFNNNLIDQTNTLKLVNTNKSSVISKSGKRYSGSIKNKLLLVFYRTSTKSIPAQTTPSKIVVM